MFKNRHPDLETPDSDLRYVILTLAEELGGKPALIDSPTERTLSYTQLSQPIQHFAADSTSAALRKMTSSPRSFRTCLHRPRSFWVSLPEAESILPLTLCIQAATSSISSLIPTHASYSLFRNSWIALFPPPGKLLLRSPIYSSMLATPHPSLSTQKQI